jgi:hypothetical protein
MDVQRLLEMAFDYGKREVFLKTGCQPRLSDGTPLGSEPCRHEQLEALAAGLPARRQAQLATRGNALDALDIGTLPYDAGALFERDVRGDLSARIWGIREQDRIPDPFD